jgi:hypothetical protein
MLSKAHIINFTLPLLVGKQGVRLLENASIFCVRCIAAGAFLVLREQRVKGDPAGANALRRLPRPPAIAVAWNGDQQGV